MKDFEWISPLSPCEGRALKSYKDNTYLGINRCLRAGNLPTDVQEQVNLLDKAIAKGRCTNSMTLYRAMSTAWLRDQDGVLLPASAFLSTSIRYDCIDGFFDDNTPAILVIECPPQTPMAAFEQDERGGDEYERLLPRGLPFCIKKKWDRPVQTSKNDVCGLQNVFNKTYRDFMLLKAKTVLYYILEPIF
jgi:hypothetical protein